MLAPQIAIEPKVLLPLDDCERGVESIEVCDLDVAGVVVVRVGIRKRYPLLPMVAPLGRDGRDRQHAAESFFDELDPHADIDKRDLPIEQFGYDVPLDLPPIKTEKDELHPTKVLKVGRVEVITMGKIGRAHV